MRRQKVQFAITAVLLLLALVTCGPSGDEPTPQATDAPPPPTAEPLETQPSDRCGDGLCDEAEQANPELCPQDCAQPEAEPGGRCGDGVCDDREQQVSALCPQDCLDMPEVEFPHVRVLPKVTATSSPKPKPPGQDSNGAASTQTPLPAVVTVEAAEPTGEWLLVVDACGDWNGTEPSAHLCTHAEICLSIDAEGRVSGSDRGTYDQSTCAYTSPGGCVSYQVTCPDFSISASGEVVDGILRVLPDGSQIWEEVVATEVCLTGAQVYSGQGSMMQTAYGSAARNGGGILCEIELRDGAHVDVNGTDAVVGGLLSYSFSVDIFAGCD